MKQHIFALSMNIILFDNPHRHHLQPLTLTNAVAGLRAGIFTVSERWALKTGADVFLHTEGYLQPMYPVIPHEKSLWIDAALITDKTLDDKILALEEGSALFDDTGLVAGVLNINPALFKAPAAEEYFVNIHRVPQPVKRLLYPWQIFQWNDALIREDFNLVKATKTAQELPTTNQYLHQHDVFIEEGAQVNFAILNAATGPIYIGKNAVVMEGTTIRGPFALCEGATVKMGARIYGATTLGPFSTVGGEIKNCVLQGFSNKGHDGYLGDSVIGKWCNLGAGTSNSNVKNTGAEVKMWHYPSLDFMAAGPKAGVIMGDYTRAAINTSFNTGTVTGVCCNIFSSGLLPKFIPDFSWGGKDEEKYLLEKALRDIANWKKMKHHTLCDAEKDVLKHIFERI
jgi:UDP-N-acetylglucosamine diphosphorylase/glucosamine-1-phosphate N-acetyltransferase